MEQEHVFVVVKIGPSLHSPCYRTKIEALPAIQTERLREWEGGCHYCCISWGWMGAEPI
jgi:hypothetical protein